MEMVLRRDDHLEMLHLQAWYFQVRHFPRLSWVRLDAPAGEWFITSDRGVAWLQAANIISDFNVCAKVYAGQNGRLGVARNLLKILVPASRFELLTPRV